MNSEHIVGGFFQIVTIFDRWSSEFQWEAMNGKAQPFWVGVNYSPIAFEDIYTILQTD